MELNPNKFQEAATIALDNIPLKTALFRATTNTNLARTIAIDELDEYHEARQQARGAKLRALHDLPDLLEQVEHKVTAAGGTVLWAVDGDETKRHVLDICRKHNVQRGVKSKSMVTEEIGLVPFLEQHGITMVETDLGEYIVQISGDHPSHIVMPVMHHTKEAIRDILMKHADMPYVDTPEEMTAFARRTLRNKYLQADLGMSGSNFIIAETGHIVTVTNEGNGRLSTGVPPVHVAIVGIEKVIPTWEDFLTLVQLLARHGTGQKLTVYTNIVRSTAQEGDGDGPQHLYLILVDNGRSDIYASEYTEALACIRCGACLNVCPVYQSVGGHAYGAVYSGPIGAVITPLLKGKENAVPLPFASSLCGACKAACPVDINIPDMLLKLRHDLESEQEAVWRVGMKGFAFGMSHPIMYQAGGKATAAMTEDAVKTNETGESVIGALPFPFNGWTEKRDFPPFAEQRFRDWWKENRKKKS